MLLPGLLQRVELGAATALLALSAALLSPSGIPTANAQPAGLYCANRIVAKGDPAYRVLKLCGEPDARAQRVVYRTVRRKVRVPCGLVQSSFHLTGAGRGRCSRTEEEVVEVVLDEWTYDFGRNRLIHYLLFEADQLIEVRVGGYGVKD
jgi:hypothetical protein